MGKVVNQLEMLFRCCEKALKDKPEKAGLKSGKTKMKYSEALVMMGVLKDYFALRGAFSIGICKDCTKFSTNRMVAPLAGAWIETLLLCNNTRITVVAPLAGAWIETEGRQTP